MRLGPAYAPAVTIGSAPHACRINCMPSRLHTCHIWPCAPPRYGLRTLRDCAALCRTCAHCVFVSFNLANDDCSWYRQCDLGELEDQQGGYRSMRVREGAPEGELTLF